MSDGDWRTVFGHAEPYPQQVDGVETAVDTARDEGFLALEGACGTGKTMLALTAGIHLVRDPDSRFERVVALTSVKQQLRGFEADLRRINDDLPGDWDPVSGLTLVGKADVCPYNREGTAGFDDDVVYDRCETLRDRTRDLTGEGGATTARNLASRARSQQTGLADSGQGGAATYLETADEPAPYAPDLPMYEDVEYCPFYAEYLDSLPDDGDAAEAIPVDVTDLGHVGTEDLVSLAVEHGTCPHSLMGAMLGEVEVVLGNYYHAFDPTTVASFTGELLDESTFVICDEAHMLEPRVRDLISEGIADASLRDAETELTQVIQPLAFDDSPDSATTTDADLVRGELAETDVDREDLQYLRSFVRDLREELDRQVRAYLDREHAGWRANLQGLSDAEIPLRDPEIPAEDEISEWARDAGYGDDVWVRAEEIGAVVTRILDEADDEERTRAVTGVGRTLGEWYRRDEERHFREIELERTWDDAEPGDSWRRAYTARLALHNCVPGDAIGERLATFGGGVLMSATLEPLDVFAEVTGLEHLRADEDRPVVERTYGLHFPAENRESFAVAAPKFTYDNRGPPGGVGGGDRRPDGNGPEPGTENDTRRVYADAIRTVARSPGNVLVGMPSYAEAEWAAAVLRDAVDKPVLLDEASEDAVTEDLKERFFDGDGKVLVTSLRGTLTEGVDYQGDRLAAAVVCGVPIVNTSSPHTTAVRTAYDRVFGGESRGGFEYALTIPAVRKARQAIGRVIRGPEEVGVRVLVDERYARDSWDSVREYVPEESGFQPVSSDMLNLGLERFWDGRA